MAGRLTPLTQVSLRDRVMAAVRDAVVRGEFRPGEKVPESELAVQLGVSRTPVREALRVLEYQGLVVTRPKNGTFIADPDEAALRNGLSVRACLEQLALREVMTNDEPEGWATMCDELGEQLDRMDEATKKRDPAGATEADIRWHELLVGAASNPPLMRAWHTVGSPTLVWSVEIKQYPLQSSDWVGALAEHRRLLSIFRDGDVEASVRAIEAHIIGKLDAATVSFSSADTEPSPP